MKRWTFGLIVAVAFSCLMGACRLTPPKIERAFYYWKDGQYSLADREWEILKELKVQKLYVKFFEIGQDSVLGAIPTVKTELHLWNYNIAFENDSALQLLANHLKIIPTIYLRNDLFHKTSIGMLDTLADNILYLTGKYYKNQIQIGTPTYRELQLDCDWTPSTRDNYFYLLKKLKSASDLTISCTLRLYPYKYRENMGIPPVDKAILMCYNLISPLASGVKNSILDLEELSKYLKNSAPYPLHLDYALPLFSWSMVYQNDQFAGIIPSGRLNDHQVKPISPLWGEVLEDVELNPLYLRKGDKIKTEEVSAKNLQEAISALRRHTSIDDTTTILLFHLDEANLAKYDHETLDLIYTAFGK